MSRPEPPPYPAVVQISKARLKAARGLLRSAGRQSAGRFLVEGPQAIREALVAGAAEEVVVATTAIDRHRALIDNANARGLPTYEAADADVAALSGTTTPQGLVAVCRWPRYDLADGLPGQARLVAVLASVRDPGNAGTVIRTADAACADLVVTTAGSVDVVNPKCVRASTGSIFHLPIASGAPVTDVLDLVRQAGLRVLAADGAGTSDLDDELDAGRLQAPTAWVFGNEAWGLPDEVLSRADAVVRVPIHGRAESLNLATAAAICLYSSARAQRARP